MRPYKIVAGTAQCTNCGKGMQKSYIPLNTPHPYCEHCVNTVFGINLTKEELSVPLWLVKLADEYFNYRLYLAQYKGQLIEDGEDFANSFYFINPTHFTFLNSNRAVNEQMRVAVNGKEIKAGWQLAIFHHLLQRRWSLTHDNKPQTLITEFIVCPECKKRMYYKGLTGKDLNGKFAVYRCLTAIDSCSISKNIDLFAYHGGTTVTPIPRTDRNIYQHN